MKLMEMKLIFDASLLLLVGLLAGKLVNIVRLPAVTGYLLAGIVIGPSFLSLLGEGMLDATDLISNVALSLIAFNIGAGLTAKNLRKLGKGVVLITILEALGATMLVTIVMFAVLRQSLAVSLLYGAIAAATAPAATVMVVRESRAKGPFTDTLLAVVALDDYVCVMVFSLIMGISSMLLAGSHNFTFMTLFRPLLEIAFATLLGGVVGVLLNLVTSRLSSKDEVLTATLGSIFLAGGIALFTGLPILLVNMALGVIVGNLCRRADDVLDSIRNMDSPIYVMFFMLAGASLQVEYLSAIGVVGITYVIVRVIGKIAGASLGAYLVKAPDTVRKYLGLGLVPQAGVALGLSLLVRQQLGDVGALISSTIVATTVVYELIGPACSKFAIVKSGEARNV